VVVSECTVCYRVVAIKFYVIFYISFQVGCFNTQNTSQVSRAHQFIKCSFCARAAGSAVAGALCTCHFVWLQMCVYTPYRVSKVLHNVRLHADDVTVGHDEVGGGKMLNHNAEFVSFTLLP